jgi:hypothetical protein
MNLSQHAFPYFEQISMWTNYFKYILILMFSQAYVDHHGE